MSATVAVRNIHCADAAHNEKLGAAGTDTVHEAQGRSGLMRPYLRPIQQGACMAGSAVTAPGASWRQLDAPCGD